MTDLYALSSYALADIAQIWNFIRQHNLDAANRVEMELLETCELLANRPGLGHRRVDYTKADVLFFPVYSYLIAYRPGTAPLQILAVVHGGRNVRKLFKQRQI